MGECGGTNGLESLAGVGFGDWGWGAEMASCRRRAAATLV